MPVLHGWKKDEALNTPAQGKTAQVHSQAVRLISYSPSDWGGCVSIATIGHCGVTGYLVVNQFDVHIRKYSTAFDPVAVKRELNHGVTAWDPPASQRFRIDHIARKRVKCCDNSRFIVPVISLASVIDKKNG